MALGILKYDSILSPISSFSGNFLTKMLTYVLVDISMSLLFSNLDGDSDIQPLKIALEEDSEDENVTRKEVVVTTAEKSHSKMGNCRIAKFRNVG